MGQWIVGSEIIGDLSQRTGSFHSGFVFMSVCWTIAAVLVLGMPAGVSGLMEPVGPVKLQPEMEISRKYDR